MDLAVAVRAEHHALGELGDDRLPFVWNTSVGDPETLLRRIPMVKFKDRGDTVAGAGLAGPAHVLDRAELPAAAVLDRRMTTARVQLGMPTPVLPATPEFPKFLGLVDTRWALRRVMRTERRTVETEASPIQEAQSVADDLPLRERCAACLTDLIHDRAMNGPARLSQRSMWKAVEALLSSTDVRRTPATDTIIANFAPQFRQTCTIIEH